MSDLSRADFFEVQEDDYYNIRKRGYYGKDGLEIGYMAAYLGPSDGGFVVMSKEHFEEEYGKDEMER